MRRYLDATTPAVSSRYGLALDPEPDGLAGGEAALLQQRVKTWVNGACVGLEDFLAVGIGQHDDSFWRLNVLPGNLARNGALHSATLVADVDPRAKISCDELFGPAVAFTPASTIDEAIALAGHLKLNKLIVLFDDNGISIDGALSLADSVDQVKRFEAAGWNASRISLFTT